MHLGTLGKLEIPSTHTSPSEYIFREDMCTFKSYQFIGNTRDRGTDERTPWDAISKYEKNLKGQRM